MTMHLLPPTCLALALALSACAQTDPDTLDRSVSGGDGGGDERGDDDDDDRDDDDDDDREECGEEGHDDGGEEGQDDGGDPPGDPPGLCGDVELHVVSLYDAYDSILDQEGVAHVHVDRPGQVRLFLASYSAVTWNVTTGPDTMLVDVTAHGYDAQTIVAPDGVPTAILGYDVDFTFLGCAYEYPDQDLIDGCETPELLANIEATLGQPVSSFHGCYAASEFTIAADLSATSNCWTEAGYVQTDAVFCGEAAQREE